MRASCAVLALLAACTQGPTEPEAVAAAWCKAHYDILMRWVGARGRHPETENEIRTAAKLGDNDPWGNSYVVEMEDGETRVCSFGPDGERSDDDVCYPPLDSR